ncbi:FecR family protein [Pedobacter xixiisoli]|uniref:FecR family protein n=1 Tax=Pedobacter xixiisoli TaxID=1476464 RepID=A0A285ZUN0_9SPHI|nr:FecR family protein [Pedobacter xixiisoli]SOD13363.1 FecR family protein [Pedobacter xixiisoli]
MKNYENFGVEDFLADESFIDWVKLPNDEQDQFWAEFMASHPAKQEEIDRAKTILLSLQLQPATAPLSANEKLAIHTHIHSRTIDIQEKPAVRLYAQTWFKVAAVLLVVLASSIWIYNAQLKHSTADTASVSSNFIDYVNNDKIAKLIKLEDGSMVVLSPNSKLHYPKKFDDTIRRVELEGEAFFEVQKNPNQPFVVYSDNMVTKVLGTSFTVSAFLGQKKSVVVNTGRVQVLNQDQEQRTISEEVITANQQVILTKKDGELNKQTLAVPLVLSLEVALRTFKFDNAPVGEIVAKLEEAYHVKINYNQEKYAKATVTASLGQLSLEEKIKMICKAIDADCNFNEGQITIN